MHGSLHTYTYMCTHVHRGRERKRERERERVGLKNETRLFGYAMMVKLFSGYNGML